MAYNRFITGILPDHNYRFILGSITDVALEVGQTLQASPQITALMGETMLGCFFLAGHSQKAHRTVIGVDMQSNGPVRKLMAFASSDGIVRAFCSSPDASWEGGLYEGKKDGLFTVNRFVEENRKVYSSTVAMHDLSLEKNFEEYLGRSDQKLGFIRIESTLDRGSIIDISGMSFEALPGASLNDSERVLDMIRPNSTADIVHPMIADGDGERRNFQSSIPHVKILKTGRFEYRCDCTREKIEKVLLAMGEDSIQGLLQEQGYVEVFCEFCRRRYEFKAREIQNLFGHKENE